MAWLFAVWAWLPYLPLHVPPAVDAVLVLQPVRWGILVAGVLWLAAWRVLSRERSARVAFVLVGSGCVMLAMETFRTVPCRLTSRDIGLLSGPLLTVFVQNVDSAPPDAWEAWLSEHTPDLVLLQEVYTENLAAWKALADRLGYAAEFVPLRDDAGIGNLTLVRSARSAELVQGLTGLRIDVPSSGGMLRSFPLTAFREGVSVDVIRVLNVHLESTPRTAGIGGVMASASLRVAQSEILARNAHLDCDHAIIAGDFNSTPTNVPLRKLRHAGWTDAWVAGGHGTGCTFPMRNPVLRIDGVLVRGLDAVCSRTVAVGESDHRGIWVGVRVR